MKKLNKILQIAPMFFMVIALACLACGDVINFVLMGTLSALSYTSPYIALACLLQPTTVEKCPIGRAGINKFWATSCDNILDIVFDPISKCVDAIIMDGDGEQPIFVCFEFEKDTAFFNQDKTRVGQNINVAQTISFVEPVMTNENQCALYHLNTCCCLVAIVRDNTGRYHLAGVTYFPEKDEWQFEDMTTGAGSGNTGANSTSDTNQFLETLTANTSWYAPTYNGDEASIPV